MTYVQLIRSVNINKDSLTSLLCLMKCVEFIFLKIKKELSIHGRKVNYFSHVE